MRFIPVLFSTPMVQAILEGRKTKTRRIIDPQPTDFVDDPLYWINPVPCIRTKAGLKQSIKSRYGQPGDVLWVRESASFFVQGNGTLQREKTKYKADRKWDENDLIKWKPSIHMPKAACRIFLKVKSVRVEQLQDITEADAIAEGITLENLSGDWDHPPTSEFQRIWEKINGIDSWDSNPWVWVIEFERIAKPQNF